MGGSEGEEGGKLGEREREKKGKKRRRKKKERAGDSNPRHQVTA